MKRLIITLMLAIAVFALSEAALGRPAAENAIEQDNQNTLSAENVIKYCKYYIATLPSDDPQQEELRKNVMAQITIFAINTDKFVLSVGGEMELVREASDKCNYPELLGVFISGEVLYCLEHNLSESNAASFVSAMQDVLNHYSRLPEHKAKSLNKYLDMDDAKRAQALEKYYNKNHG